MSTPLNPEFLIPGAKIPPNSHIEGKLTSLLHTVPSDAVLGFQITVPRTASGTHDHQIDILVRPVSQDGLLSPEDRSKIARALESFRRHLGNPVVLNLNGGEDGVDLEVHARKTTSKRRCIVTAIFSRGSSITLIKGEGKRDILDFVLHLTPAWFNSSQGSNGSTPPKLPAVPPSRTQKRKEDNAPDGQPQGKRKQQAADASTTSRETGNIPAKGKSHMKNSFKESTTTDNVRERLHPADTASSTKPHKPLTSHRVPLPVKPAPQALANKVFREETASPIQSSAAAVSQWKEGNLDKENNKVGTTATEGHGEMVGARKALAPVASDSAGSLENSQPSSLGEPPEPRLDKGKGKELAVQADSGSDVEMDDLNGIQGTFLIDQPSFDPLQCSYLPTPTPGLPPMPYAQVYSPITPFSASPSRADHSNPSAVVNAKVAAKVAERSKKQKKHEKKLLKIEQRRQAKIAEMEKAASEAGRKSIERYERDPSLRVNYVLGSKNKVLEYKALAEVGANDKDGSDPNFTDKGKADIIVAVRSAQTYGAAGATDFRIVLQVQDASRYVEDDYTTVTLFSKTKIADFPGHVVSGSAILLRELWYDRSNRGRLTFKAMSSKGWTWAMLAKQDDGSSPVFIQGSPPRRPICPEVNLDERTRLRQVVDWYTLRVKPSIPLITAIGPAGVVQKLGRQSGRPVVTLETMECGVFCDITVQVIGVVHDRDEAKFEIAVADYTTSFQYSSDRTFGKEGLEPGMVSHFTLWDEAACSGKVDLTPGTIVHFANVQVKNGGLGLEGTLRGYDASRGRGAGGRYKILPQTDPMARQLLARRAESLRQIAFGGTRQYNQPTNAYKAEDKEMSIAKTAMTMMIWTTHNKQPKSSVEDVLANRTVPNRFRVLASVDEVQRLPGQDYWVAWCKRCDASFNKTPSFDDYFCSKCQDQSRDSAEYRWRFFISLRDENDSVLRLPVQIWQPHVRIVMPTLPGFPRTEAELAEFISNERSLTNQLANMLYGNKVNGEHPHLPIDWSIESFLACRSDGVQQRMFRAFDMQ